MRQLDSRLGVCAGRLIFLNRRKLHNDKEITLGIHRHACCFRSCEDPEQPQGEQGGEIRCRICANAGSQQGSNRQKGGKRRRENLAESKRIQSGEIRGRICVDTASQSNAISGAFEPTNNGIGAKPAGASGVEMDPVSRLDGEKTLKAKLRQITGNWLDGFVLDKHTLHSQFAGYNEWGHEKFDTTRTEVGEALFQLKYRQDFNQVKPLAKAVVRHIIPKFEDVGLVVPAPASTTRARQPVAEIAREVADRIGVPFFDNLVVKSVASENCGSLKDLDSKEEKVAALKGRFVLNKAISNSGRWNAIVIDDLYQTGATMEAVCEILSGYCRIGGVYVAALTWR